MAMVSEETNSTCSHCNRSIPSLNMDLHYAHCFRNLEKCVVCGDMIPRKHAEEHYQSTHAPEVCGNRTESCQRCGRYIRLRDRYAHETTCNGIADNAVGSFSRRLLNVFKKLKWILLQSVGGGELAETKRKMKSRETLCC